MNMNSISNESCASTQVRMQNNGKNLCFNGSVGQGLQKYIEKCKRDELIINVSENSKLSQENITRMCSEIKAKWDNLLKVLEQKMKLTHKNSVIDYGYVSDDDVFMEGLIYQHAKIKSRHSKIMKPVEKHHDGFDYRQTKLADIENKTDVEYKTSYHRDDCVFGDINPKDIFNIKYNNILHFMEEMSDKKLAQRLQDYTQQAPAGNLFKKLRFNRDKRKVADFCKDISKQQ